MKKAFILTLSVLFNLGVFAQIIQLGSDIEGESSGDQSGSSVAMSDDGHVVAVGAFKNDGSAFSAGHVRVHKFDGTSWAQLGNDIDGEAKDDQSGKSVALNKYGNIVAIGANLNDGVQFGFTKGHVRVYQWQDTAWTKLGGDINGEHNGDWSGWSVALSDDGYTVAIGAVLNDGGAQNGGQVRVYKYNGSNWYKVGADLDGTQQNSYGGTSVSLSSNGNRVAIGLPGGGGWGSPSGLVRVMELDSTGTWVQMGNNIYAGATRLTGESVSLSDDGLTIGIGAPATSATFQGYAMVYHFDGTLWNKVGSDMVGEGADDEFGASVALSGDGNTILVGGPNNDGAGADAGHARLYKFNGTSWVKVGADYDGEAAGDNYGFRVAMNNDGDMFVIGGLNNDDAGGNSGHARVFAEPNPVALIATSSNTVACKNSVTFNAAMSYHLDTLKSIQSFQWDVNDDGTIDYTDTSFTQTYSNTGFYKVELKVIDNLGQVDSNSIEIMVIDTNSAYPDKVLLDTLFAECSLTPNTPTATDSCAGPIVGTPDVSFPITQQGSTVITWSYDDGSGNVSSQQQLVILNDTTAPVPNNSSLGDISAICEVKQNTVTVPRATDACEGNINATTNTNFPITDTTVKTIEWTFDDGNGNTSFLIQNIIWTPIDVTTNLVDLTITANKNGVNYQWLNCDSNYAPIANETSRNFVVNTNGNYAVEITESNCVDTSECVTITGINVSEVLRLKDVNVYPNPSYGDFNIDLGRIKTADIKLYNVFGQVLYQKENIHSSRHQFTIEVQPSIYFIEVNVGNAKKKFKITVLD